MPTRTCYVSFLIYCWILLVFCSACPAFLRLLHLRADPAGCMEPPREGSPYNACSTLLSMECQVMDQQSASKPSAHGTGLQQASLNKTSTSCVSSNINEEHGKEQMEDENAHNGMMQGSMIFDMLSAMQFNAHTTMQEQASQNSFLNITTPSSQRANPGGNNMSPDGSPPWHLHLYNNNARAIDIAPNYQAHMDNMHQSTVPPGTFDPIASFLKLPVLADQTKLGLPDQRLISSYANYISNNKEDLYVGVPQAYSATNTNWVNSLQLESIRDCSNVNPDNMENAGHAVQYLGHRNIEGVSDEAKLLMKLNGEEATMSSHDNIASHEERVLNESYNSSSLHMLPNFQNGEQLLYTLNEGGDIEGGHGNGMLDNMQMMMMGYNNDPRVTAEFEVVKGSTCSSVMAGSVKTTRKRGVRGGGKNSEDRENQRMTHIAVERNRRRQMNEHLRVLRTLMPPSYIQRGDQASIIGGAIEFVRELEQLLQCLESQKRRRIMVNPVNVMPQPTLQQGLLNTQAAGYGAPSSSDHQLHHQLQVSPCMLDEGGLQNIQEEVAQAKSAVADIEVKVVEKSEALIKILSQRRPRQLLHTIQALQEHLHLSILHTNVTTIDNTVLYSFTVKIHQDLDYSANNIATLVHEIFIDITDQNPIKDL